MYYVNMSTCDFSFANMKRINIKLSLKGRGRNYGANVMVGIWEVERNYFK